MEEKKVRKGEKIREKKKEKVTRRRSWKCPYVTIFMQ